ncbi:MAG: SHOCT domain-containing protein [Bdellovibrionaceae bacterium]|nr:SHOCT domain-containing protein [Pseudobdellovibrionaceae bacterium]
MGTLLKVIGAIWALVGFGNLVMMPWTEASEGVLTFGLMFNMLLFVVPGLIVYGIGSGISKRRESNLNAAESQVPQKPADLSVEERLKKLKALRDEAHIDEKEYESRRRDILQEL